MAKEQDDILNEVTEGEYKYGFVSDVETEMIGKGLNESVIRLISQKKEEPGMALGIPFEGLPSLAYDENAHVGEVGDSSVDYQDIVYYAAPKQEVKKSWERSIPS